MCGVIAGISQKNIVPIISSGLQYLGYRGYDSVGIAIINDKQIYSVKAVGNFSELEKKLHGKNLHSTIGIGHTRWATHGAPTIENAHPHFTENVAIVHNGIIENYQSIKTELELAGYKFDSETDSAVIAKLLDYYLQQESNPLNASHKTISRLQGSYSVIFMFKDTPDLLFVAKNKTSLIIGIGNEGVYVVSDVVALGQLIEYVVYLEDNDRAMITGNSYQIFDKNKQPLQRKASRAIVTSRVDKGDYPNFMLKEINEQPILFKQVTEDYLDRTRFKKIDIDWNEQKRIRIIACGTSYLAGLVGKYWLEEFIDVPVDLEIASEYRYRKTPELEKSVTIIISQSGETLDTLEALKKVKSYGQKSIAIVNAEHSSIARVADYILPIIAGVEIAVASTKAFLNQIAVLATLALDIAVERRKITINQKDVYHKILKEVPSKIKQIIQNSDKIRSIAKEMIGYNNVLFIGRGLLYPIALEGALKLKELSYIHAEGYAGGELKHGPISLIDKKIALVALIPSGRLFEKMYSNLQEVVARGAQTLCISDKRSIPKLKSQARWILEIPECDDFISPMIYTLPMQLLAYHIANEQGNNIDQPRNLAKSVTVE